MITSEEPKVAINKRYSISEAACLLGIDRKTLRKYTAAGYIRCGIHKYNMKKFYTGYDIKAFWVARL